jgi:hypothetical protein
MKYFTLISILTLWVGCSQKSQTPEIEISATDAVDHGLQLFESGFLEFADTSKFDSLKSGLLDSFDIYNADTYKIAHIDAEELAEFNFDFFVVRLNKMLSKRKFNLVVQKTDDYETTNDIRINRKTLNLYTNEELQNGNFWQSASINFFRELNTQLSKQKITESFYLLYEGNDLHALLLTPNQHKIIAEKYKTNTGEIPWLP